MSSFTCEQCGKSIIDDNGYITECEHYPAEGDEMKDEIGERLDREIRLYQSPANKGETLMERVIEQVKKDVADKELQPLALLLSNIDRRLLESFMEAAEEEA